jgi:DNA-binding GntR family transcriptional regulator
MSSETKTIRSHAVHEQLRTDIIRGVHKPGAPMRLAKLAREFDVSMSVIREALIRLSEQHLVVLSPHQGFRVAEVSLEDLADLTELRITLECKALHDSITRGTAQWEAQVIATHHMLSRAPLRREGELGTTEEWSKAHRAFHDALGAACGSPRLIDLIGSLRDNSEHYRQLTSRHDIDQTRDIAGEHLELMTLATERQADAAVEALAQHIRRSTDMLLAAESEDN